MLAPLEDCLSNPSIPGRLRTNVELAHHNALRLLKLVNALLDFGLKHLADGALRF